MNGANTHTEITADGSPTLRVGFELMHNAGGAWSETAHVYGHAIDYVLAHNWPPRLAVAGLGLGYIEYLILAKRPDAVIDSFESETSLTDGVLAAVGNQPAGPFSEALDAVSARTFTPRLREIAREAIREGRWRFQGSIEDETPREPVSGVLFDPFSRTVAPQLWEPAFLARILNDWAAPHSVFATYASFGELKRVLGRCGFELTARRGFGAKRECTFGVRPGLSS